MTGGKGDEPIHTCDEQGARRDEQCLHAPLNQSLERDVDVDVGTGLEDGGLTADRTSSRHDLRNTGVGHRSQGLRTYEHPYQDRFRRQFTQQSKLLWHQRRRDTAHASEVASWSAETGDKTRLHWVAPDIEDDWNSRGRRLGRLCRGLAATGDNNRNLARHEIVDELRQALVPPFCPSDFDRDVPALDEACLPEALPKGRQHRSVGHRRSAAEISDHGQRRLLRARRYRPRRRRSPEQRDEL